MLVARVASLFENRLLHDAKRVQHELMDDVSVERAILTRGNVESVHAIDVIHELFLQQTTQTHRLPTPTRACREGELWLRR